ncbi:MAG: DinB family protein [Candidatus Hermodarchaeota archaeon]
MKQTERIARLVEQTFEGNPYYGYELSVLGSLEGVTASIAVQKPSQITHSIWEIVLHLTTELRYALEVIQGTAGPMEDTWPEINDKTEQAYEKAIDELKKANRALVSAIENLDDSVLELKPIRVRGPYYTMLHGTMQHSIYHTGQIIILRKLLLVR